GLPTEEEWEYACRGAARSQEECSFDFYLDRPTNDLSSRQANFNGYPAGKAAKGKRLGRTTKVGSYPPNRLGLHDMHGNVLEGTASVQGWDRVIRGGNWFLIGSHCGAAYRSGAPPSYKSRFVGFRLALGSSAAEAAPKLVDGPPVPVTLPVGRPQGPPESSPWLPG